MFRKTANTEICRNKDKNRNNNLAAKRTKEKEDKLKLLYVQKHKINKNLYQLHLHNANIWNTWWSHIEHKIHQKLQHEMKETVEK
jgi:hypothetical protein